MQYHTYLSNSLYRLKVIIIPFVLFILVFLVACPDAPFSEQVDITRRFTGTVTDANSGLPIANATVQMYNGGVDEVLKSTETDQEGRYDMEYKGLLNYPSPRSGLPQWNQLRAMAEGYSTRYNQINRTALFQTIDFQLPPIN
jgi:5-hydroxyisourate hydrolase-like protein (transthyretin family)